MCPTHRVVDVETGELSDEKLPIVRDLRNDVVPQSFDEAMALWEDAIEVKSEWELLTDKRFLVGKPFFIQNVRFYEGSYGPAVAVMVITKDNQRFVFNDGSTGIMQELMKLCQKHDRFGGFVVPNGLRVSEYDFEVKDFDGNPTGEVKHAKTYYLS